jgi:2-formylbenzoate dehydrogenase
MGHQASSPTDEVTRHPWRHLIGGRLVDADGERIPTWNPATGQPLAQVPLAGRAQVDQAVEAAARAAPGWRETGIRERARLVRRMAALVQEHREELAVLDALDSGNPLSAMRADVDIAVEMLEFAADAAVALQGSTIPASPEHLSYTVREPFGVVVRLVPYNHPAMFAAGKIAAPLVAGNAVVLKPADQTPLSALRLGELFRKVLPDGVLNVLAGPGASTGDALVRHPLVRRIAHTGTARTGRAIQTAAAESGVKHVTLQLGGKNAMIVYPDADVQQAAAAAVAGMNFTISQGQSCGSTSRILVHRDLAADLVQAVREAAEAIRVGMPLEHDTEMGPLISADHLDRVLGYVSAARDAGARLVTGGARPDAELPEGGYFLTPTVLTDVAQASPLGQEEVFGPVMAVLEWADEAQVIAVANGVEYGLTASVWTNDLVRAHTAAARLQAGYVWVNDVSRHFIGTPFGGTKSSGVGREEDMEELLGYTETKAVHVRLVPR